MKQIELSGVNGKGIFALVDDDNYEYLNQFKWYIRKQKNINYARRNKPFVKGDMRQILMHREILCLTKKNEIGEHKDHNGLNNQKSNLRVCDTRQNAMNKRPKENSTSKYLGVSICNVKGTNKETNKVYKYWQVSIKHKGICINLGTFPYTDEGEILAAKRYDEKAKEYFDEFANLNFKEDA